jgi:hypothetical protein
LSRRGARNRGRGSRGRGLAKGPQLTPGATRAPLSGAGGAMLPGASGRAGIGATAGSPGGFNMPAQRNWRSPFGPSHPGRANATQPPGRGMPLPPDNRHPTRRHGAPMGGAGDDALAANPSFEPNQTDWRRPGPGLRHAPGNIGYGEPQRPVAGREAAEEDARTYGGPVNRYGEPQKPANEWTEGQYPGETPWHPISSKYRTVRPDQPPPYIRDVDIDYNWFSPFQPVWPFGPPYVTYPREWDYPVGINLEYQPRRMGLYAMLRAMSYGWGILRAVIETRKDQLMRIPWDIRLINGSAKSSARDPRVQNLKEFFKKPDRKHRWQAWCRLILEDLLVIDAPAIYIWRSQAGTPYALECLDGATIKILIDDAGRVPDPPSPAYQQTIKGLPMVDFRADEIIYAPMRPRPELPIYGYSPVEQCFLEITEGIRRTLYQLDYWSEGSVPDLIVTVPEGWTPAQISQFQAYTDALLGGNLHQKSKIRFLPGGMKPFDIKSAGGELLKSDYDEWLARIVCFAFSISPQGFVKMMNRATAESSDQAAKEEGLYPLMTYFESEIMNPLIQEHFGYSDIEFKFQPRPEVDALKQAQALQIYVQSGVLTVDEARTQLGLPKLSAKSAP